MKGTRIHPLQHRQLVWEHGSRDVVFRPPQCTARWPRDARSGPYGIQVHWVYGPPLPLGLDPEARQALIRERIAKIFEQMSSNTDPSVEDREYTRPMRDSVPGGIT